MDFQHPLQKDDIHGEVDNAIDITTAENPMGRADGFHSKSSLSAEESEHIDKVSTIDSHLDGDHAQSDTTQS